jgi:MoxR-like ATPase
MLNLGYPEYTDEVMILEREEHDNPLDAIDALMTMVDIIALQEQARQVDVVRHLKEYIVQVNQATRVHPDVVLGISPRGGVAMQRCAQGLALIRGRDFVTPDDIKSAARAVGGHRILTRDRKPDTAKAVLDDVLNSVRIPVE